MKPITWKPITWDQRRKCKHCGKFNTYEYIYFHVDRNDILDVLDKAEILIDHIKGTLQDENKNDLPEVRRNISNRARLQDRNKRRKN